MKLDGGQTVVRSALVPRLFDDHGHVSARQIVAGFLPHVLSGGSNGFALSVGWRDILQTQTNVHAYGCKVADAANVFVETKKQRPLEVEEIVYYRGSYDLGVASIETVATENFILTVVLAPENGLNEHCNIEMQFLVPVSGSQERKSKTYATVALSRLLKSPSEHVCAANEDVRQYLEGILLTDFQASRQGDESPTAAPAT